MLLGVNCCVFQSRENRCLTDRETNIKYRLQDKFSSRDKEARKEFVGRLITALQNYSESNNVIEPNSFPNQVKPSELYDLIKEGLEKFKPRTTDQTNPDYQKSLHFQLKRLERNLNYNEDGLHKAAETYQTSVKKALSSKLEELKPTEEFTEREHTDYRQFPGRS